MPDKTNQSITEVFDQIRPLFADDQIIELRALKVTDSYGKPYTVSGFFDVTHLADMAKAALELSPRAAGVYFTINPINPALQARRHNRIDRAESGSLTTDKDINRRRWLLIDIDPTRPSGISATDTEKQHAYELAMAVWEYLSSLGFPAPIFVDSGNGYHLYYLIDLPANDGGIVQRCLQALGDMFDDEYATVDQTVYNASRISKLPGTLSRKGDSTPDRPHRQAKIIESPILSVVSQELLETLASKAPVDEPIPTMRTASGTGTAYGRKALENQCERVRLSSGRIWDVLRRASCSIGRCIPHLIDFTDAESALYDATVAAGGKDMDAARKTIQSGLALGMKNSRHPETKSSTSGHNRPENAGDKTRKDNKPRAVWSPEPIDLPDFLRADYRHEWLAKRLLVMREPCIVFGPSKSLKTSTVVDLAVSIASGTPALGCFPVPTPRRVLLISGESGPASLQAIVRRVCEARGLDGETVIGMLAIECSLPPLSDPLALEILRDLLAKHQRDVVIIDPAYLTLLMGGGASADSASNIFGMGPLLGALVEACKAGGSQLILIHHTNGRIAIGDAPDLSHIAYAGFQQFARQWIGLNRLEPYSYDGKHSLVIVAGGGAGHGGKWVAAIDEGELDDNFEGRKWEVSVERFVEAIARDKQEKKSAKEEKQEASMIANLQAVIEAIRSAAATKPERIAIKADIASKLLSWSGGKLNTHLTRLVHDGKIKMVAVTVASGINGKSKKDTEGYVVCGDDGMFS